MRFTYELDTTKMREAIDEKVALVQQTLAICDRVAEELGFTRERLHLRMWVSADALAYRLTVDGREMHLPRDLHQRSNERIEEIFREVLQGRPVLIDHTDLIDVIHKLRPARKEP